MTDPTDPKVTAEASLRATIEALRVLTTAAACDFRRDLDRELRALGVESEEAEAAAEEAREAMDAMAVAIEAATTFEVVLGAGDPDRRLCIECRGVPSHVQPSPQERPPLVYEIRRAFYRHRDGAAVELGLTPEEAEIVWRFARFVVPELDC